MLILTTLPGSGKLGGVVASRTRQGQRLYARTPKQQPRSPSQRNNLAQATSLSSAWRTIGQSAQRQWNELAAPGRTGYNSFIACNRRLQTVGLNTILAIPGQRPAFPAIAAFEVNAIYSSGAPGSYLIDWRIDTVLEQTGQFAFVVRATQALSQAKANIRPSDLRVILGALNTTTPLFIPAAAWYAAWGAGPRRGYVTFTINLIDPLSGHAGPAMSNRLYLNAVPGGEPGSLTVTIEQNGTTIAVTTGTIYEQSGLPLTGA